MRGPTCTATTTRGSRCRRAPVRGSDRCATHLGLTAGGRPTLLDDAVADKLVTMLRAGNYVAVAANAAGISEATLRDWMTRGRAGEEPYATLAERVERARSEGEVRNVATIAKAATERWDAAAWLLERQYPERWGRVSMRLRTETPEELSESQVERAHDPFAEADELAEKRRRRRG
jgi:hypothetical protein